MSLNYTNYCTDTDIHGDIRADRRAMKLTSLIPTGPSKLCDQYLRQCIRPTMVNNNYLEAQQIIQREAPLALVISLPEERRQNLQFQFERVIIYYDMNTGLVSDVPQRG